MPPAVFEPARLGPITLRNRVVKAATSRALDDGFAFVAMARALLRQPDLVNRMRDGTATESLYVHCNKCMPTIYRRTHCVLAD